ncbi:type II toxin-antitoxin system VapC family toxin [Xylophilus sp.]|uniref:type II toxin-antitoxin system VapC family toxin n=1 Tax=Xylophilus sp. TaxID=2653893 RepID=UPI002D7F342E|nr:type II toxin-antitoxin system VapC family toxin [Xylophilus sp.]
MSVPAWLPDSNVWSEAMRPVPDAGVIGSLQRNEATLALAATVWHELRYGWLRMPAGRRRDLIGSYLHDVLALLPLVPYDGAAARIHAEIRAERERSGHPLPFADGQIAAIAIAQGLTLVTRNTRDFGGISGLRLEDWHRAAPG